MYRAYFVDVTYILCFLAIIDITCVRAEFLAIDKQCR